MAVERLSLTDNTLIACYADHIQRYHFALQYCQGKRVVDAGCGIGYGSEFLASNGASSVLALDNSQEALNEALLYFSRENLAFKQMNVEEIGSASDLIGQFDLVVNFENIEHLRHPHRFIAGAASIANILITSTPNGALTPLDAEGNSLNKFHVKEFTSTELINLLTPHFDKVTLFGQWLTYAGRLRQLRTVELHRDLLESYFNPMNRIGRMIKKLFGKPTLGPPKFSASSDCYDGDFKISTINSREFPWEPAALIAVCERMK